MIIRAYRIVIIFCIVSGIFWFGVDYGPSSNNAQAKVFERIARFAKAMPPYLFDGANSSEPRKVIINNNTTWLTVTKKEGSIRNILEFYEMQYPPLELASLLSGTNLQNDKQKGRELLESNTALSVFSRLQHTVVLRESYGFWGAVEFKDLSHIGDEKEQQQIVYDAFVDGNLGQVTTGRVVIALAGEDQQTTTVLNIWTDDDFNLNNLVPDETGDVPGFDVEGVPRDHRSKRLMSLEQDNPQALYRLVQYQGVGVFAGHIDFLRAGMEMEGWREIKSVDGFSRQRKKGENMYFAQEARECSLFVEEKDSGEIVTTVIESRKHNT